MGLLERLGDLSGDVDRLVDREPPVRETRGKVLALDELHREEVDVLAVGKARGLESVEVAGFAPGDGPPRS